MAAAAGAGALRPRRRLPVAALCLVVAACLLCGGRGAAAAGGSSKKVVGVHELKRGDDFSIKVTNWGATLMSVVLPDSKGNLDDVVLGYDTVAEYVNGTAYFGGLIGRVANRIAGARFTLDGKTYKLYRNDGNNSLHGGHRGFSKVIWTVKEHVRDGDSPYITLYYHSFDGEQGFPGDLDVCVTYQLSPPQCAERAHERHGGAGQQRQGHPGEPGAPRLLEPRRPRQRPRPHRDRAAPRVALHAGRRRADPDGRAGARRRHALRAPATVGARLGELLRRRRGVAGFDTNYAVDGAAAAAALRPVARVRDGATGRAMELWADQPGVQLYTANGLGGGVRGKGGSVYGRYGALCLETQGFPVLEIVAKAFFSLCNKL